MRSRRLQPALQLYPTMLPHLPRSLHRPQPKSGFSTQMVLTLLLRQKVLLLSRLHVAMAVLPVVEVELSLVFHPHGAARSWNCRHNSFMKRLGQNLGTWHRKKKGVRRLHPGQHDGQVVSAWTNLGVNCRPGHEVQQEKNQ